METVTELTNNVIDLPTAVAEAVNNAREVASNASGEERAAVQAMLDRPDKCFSVTITPEQAAIIVSEHNKLNRDLTGAGINRIADFAKDMSEGKWHLTNQGIGFYSDKTLSDGQHRLFAVVQAGCPVDFIVAKDLAQDSVHVIDRGTPRNLAQSLGFRGVSNATDISGIAKPVYGYLHELEHNAKPRVNDVQLMAWVEQNLDALQSARKLGYDSTQNVTEPTMNPKQAAILIACMLLGGWKESAVLPFIAAVQQGLAPYSDAPSLAYSKLLQKAKYSDRKKDSLSNTARIALGLKAARYMSESQVVSRLNWSAAKEGLVPVAPPATESAAA